MTTNIWLWSQSSTKTLDSSTIEVEGDCDLPNIAIAVARNQRQIRLIKNCLALVGVVALLFFLAVNLIPNKPNLLYQQPSSEKELI